jgi:hypothetical protein
MATEKNWKSEVCVIGTTRERVMHVALHSSSWVEVSQFECGIGVVTCQSSSVDPGTRQLAEEIANLNFFLQPSILSSLEGKANMDLLAGSI